MSKRKDDPADPFARLCAAGQQWPLAMDLTGR